MGGQHSSDDSYGQVSIRVEKERYSPGQQINGFVDLRLVKPFPSGHLQLGFTGEEEVGVVLAGGGGADLSTARVAVHRDAQSLLDQRFPLYSLAGDAFPPGQHTFPFVFKLPDGLPSSFDFSYDEEGQRGYGRITYAVWAGLSGQSENFFFARRELVVSHPQAQAGGPGRKQFVHRLRGYCCSPLGQLTLTCEFDADKATVGDELLLGVGVDNRQSQADLRQVHCRFIQHVFLRTADGRAEKAVRRVLSDHKLLGCAAGQALVASQAQMLQVRVDCTSDLQPTTRGSLVRNEFAIELEPVVDAFTCCDQQPPHAFEVQVRSPHQPEPEDKLGSGWAPAHHPLFVCASTSPTD